MLHKISNKKILRTDMGFIDVMVDYQPTWIGSLFGCGPYHEHFRWRNGSVFSIFINPDKELKEMPVSQSEFDMVTDAIQDFST